MALRQEGGGERGERGRPGIFFFWGGGFKGSNLF